MFDIYIEGYKAQGNSSGAQLVIKNQDGDTFKEACINFSKTEKSKGWGNFCEDRLSLWGCRLFDNIDDARSRFG